MRRFLAALLLVVFVFGFAAEVIAYAAMDTVFSPVSYTELLQQPAFLQQLTQQVRQTVVDEVVQQANLGAFFTREDVTWMADQLITEDWVEQQADQWVRSVAEWFRSTEPEPKLSVSLSSLKEQIPALFEQLLIRKLEALPPCQTGSLLDILRALLTGQEVPVCVPSGVDIAALVHNNIGLLSGLIDSVVNAVPDEVNAFDVLLQQPDVRAQILTDLLTLRTLRRRILQGIQIGAVALAVLWLAIGALRISPARALLQWWGASLALGGALALLAVGVIYAAPQLAWRLLLAQLFGSALPGIVAQLSQSLFVSLLAAVWQRVLLIGGIAAGVGVALVLTSFALPHGREAETTV